MHGVQRCGILIPMFHGLCVCLSVVHNHESYKNWWTNYDAVWFVKLGGPTGPCFSAGPGASSGERASQLIDKYKECPAWTNAQSYLLGGSSDAVICCQSCSNLLSFCCYFHFNQFYIPKLLLWPSPIKGTFSNSRNMFLMASCPCCFSRQLLKHGCQVVKITHWTSITDPPTFVRGYAMLQHR